MMARCCNIVAGLWLTLLGHLTACDTSVPFYAESDDYFSLFGYLDARLDTQWVRVRMLQDSTLIDNGPIDATMTMTNMSTGKTVAWHDSLFRIVEGALAHNYWTTEPVFPLETYRLEVLRSGGMKSVTTVSLPDSFEMPQFKAYPAYAGWVGYDGTVIAPPRGCVLQVDVRVPALAVAEITYSVPTVTGGEMAYAFDYTRRADHVDGEDHFIVKFQVTNDVDYMLAENPYVGFTEDGVRVLPLDSTRAMEVRVAEAGPDWPDFTLDLETLTLPGAGRYVENGSGFVAGVVSRLIDISVQDFLIPGCSAPMAD